MAAIAFKTITGIDQTVALTDGAVDRASQLAIQVTGTFSAGSVAFYGSQDGGTTKVALLLVPVGSTTTATSISANGFWRLDASGIADIYAVSDGSFSGSIKLYVRPVVG